MGQKYGDDYGMRRGGSGPQQERWPGGGARGSRSDVYDEPPLEPRDRDRERERGRGTSRHSLHDDDVPDVRFGRNVGDTGGYGSGGSQRDFYDTAQGQHAGYGDYGQQDYPDRGERQRGERQRGERQRGERQRGEREAGGGRSRADYGRGEFDRPDDERGFGGARPYGSEQYGASEGERRGGSEFGRRDYRGNVGPGGYGYAEPSYGPGRQSRGGGQDWASNQPRGGQGRSFSGGQDFRGGEYRGRGPKGYTRSDQRLEEVLCELLTDAPDIDASNLEVKVSGAIVALEGTVEDRWTKYQVEEMAEQVAGVKEVRNQLRVQAGWGSSAAQRETQGSQQASGSQSGSQSSGSQSDTTGGSARKSAGATGSSTPKTG